MSRISAAALLISAFAAIPALGAQDASILAPGTRVRLTTPALEVSEQTGKVVSASRDALYGLAIGGGAGALVGALSYKKPDPRCLIFCETRSGDAVAGAVLGSIAGTIIGAFIVGSLDKTERWIPLRKTASFFVAPTSDGARLAFSSSF